MRLFEPKHLDEVSNCIPPTSQSQALCGQERRARRGLTGHDIRVRGRVACTKQIRVRGRASKALSGSPRRQTSSVRKINGVGQDAPKFVDGREGLMRQAVVDGNPVDVVVLLARAVLIASAARVATLRDALAVEPPLAPTPLSRPSRVLSLIGWSNNHFNNLHFINPLEHKHNCMFKTHNACEIRKRRLLTL